RDVFGDLQNRRLARAVGADENVLIRDRQRKGDLESLAAAEQQLGVAAQQLQRAAERADGFALRGSVAVVVAPFAEIDRAAIVGQNSDGLVRRAGFAQLIGDVQTNDVT